VHIYIIYIYIYIYIMYIIQVLQMKRLVP